MSTDAVERWVAGYRAAWESNDPDAIGALFTDDGEYRTEPYAEPWVGRQAIVDGWLAHRDEPGQTTFEFEVIAVDGGRPVVQGHTPCRGPERESANLWLVRLDPCGAHRCFVEWWMERRGP